MSSLNTDRSNSISKIRIRNSYTQRYHTKNQLHKHSIPSKTLKKQLNDQFLPQITIVPALKTESLIKPRRIIVPPIFIDSIKSTHLKTSNPQSSINDNLNQPETDIFKNANINHQSKTSFRTKKCIRTYIPIKNNFSSFFPQKPQHPNNENINQIDCNKLHVEIQDLAQTSNTERTIIHKNKGNKCLIAVSRKLPFSLKSKSKRKYTQKTDFSSTHQQIFDLDISVIRDESEAPDTPFIRRDSDIAAVFNFA